MYVGECDRFGDARSLFFIVNVPCLIFTNSSLLFVGKMIRKIISEAPKLKIYLSIDNTFRRLSSVGCLIRGI